MPPATSRHQHHAEDAFAAVDQGEFAITRFSDLEASGKQYLGIDYGAGDSTYGAIFEPAAPSPPSASRTASSWLKSVGERAGRGDGGDCCLSTGSGGRAQRLLAMDLLEPGRDGDLLGPGVIRQHRRKKSAGRTAR